MRLAFITLSLLMLFSVKGFAYNRVVLHIRGKKYENLAMNLGISNGSRLTKAVNIPGSSDDGSNWTFTYSDSIFENAFIATFRNIDETANVIDVLRFDKIVGKDTLSSIGVSFDKKQSEIELRYCNSHILNDGGAYDQKEKRYSSQRTVDDHFWVEGGNDSGVLSAIEGGAISYAYFSPPTQPYDEQFHRYLTLTRKYPDSKYLAESFANRMNNFHSKQDIRTLYQCFSPAIHQSIYGRYVKQFLDSTGTRFEYHTFENACLPSSPTGKVEPIIKDTDKYHLVVFSASWCNPCRAEVPLLKKIYKEYSGRLEMTYVTIDKPQTVKNWRSFLRDEHIPWRSLEASNKVKVIMAKYFVPQIPYSLLVPPGGKGLKVIDVRRKEDFNYLANVLNTQDLAKDSKSVVNTKGGNGKNVSPMNSAPKTQANLQKKKNQSQSNSKVLYLVDGLKMTLDNVRKIDKNKIGSVSVINNENDIKTYTSGDYNQVVLITLKKGITQ